MTEQDLKYQDLKREHEALKEENERLRFSNSLLEKELKKQKDHIGDVNGMVVKNEEIQQMINTCIKDKCWYGECDGCPFFDTEDTTDGQYFCAIRDSEDNVPFYKEWSMKDALMKEKVK